MAEEKVKVQPVRWFRGADGEGDAGDGMVAPSHAPFEVTRSRAAELKANGLITIVKAEVETEATEPGDITTDAVKARGRKAAT